MNNLAELLESVPLREQWQRVMIGLHAPKDSGEHAYAVFLIKHFFGPSVISITGSVVILAGALIVNFGIEEKPIDLDRGVVELVPDQKPIELDPPAPVEPEPRQRPVVTQNEEQDENPTSSTEPDNQDKYSGPVNPFAEKEGDGGTRDGLKDSIEDRFIDTRPIMTQSKLIIRGFPGRSDSERENLYNKYGPGDTGGKKNRQAWTVQEGAVVRALWWLKKQQQPDGSWNNTKPAMTGLALLAYLAHGDTSASKKFGPTVEKGLKWLLNNQEADGHFRGRDPHDYSQPIATYALCEAYAMTPLPEIKAAAEKAVDVIIKGQNPGGGWDYNCKPGPRDDLSYMGWCIQALKAADIARIGNEGLRDAMRKAVSGVRKNADSSGRFGYTSPRDGTGGLTGVGVLCMQMLGAGRQPEARNGIIWLQQATYNWEKPWLSSPIYYWYYVTQAKFHFGGDIWKSWDRQFSQQLIRNQKREEKAVDGPDGKLHNIGWWEPPAKVAGHTDGPVMDTALCTLQLEVYYRYLPTYDVLKDQDLEDRTPDPADLQIQVSSVNGR